MVKKMIYGLMICLLTFSLAGCGNDDSSNNNNLNNNSGNNYNGGNNNNGGSNSNGASGFSKEDVLNAIRNVGGISGEPKVVDVSSIDEAKEGTIYNDRILFITFNNYEDEDVFNRINAHYIKGSINYEGKDYPFDGWGQYAVIFLDGNKDDKIIQAMRGV